MNAPHLTDLGVPGIGAVPYGIHVCHFYPTHLDMIDGLILYFLAGLAQNERCVWVESSSYPVNEIGLKIAKHPELGDALAAGQLKVWGATEWYGEPSALNGEEVIQRLLKEEDQALADGFHGLRVASNCSFVSADHWRTFMDYEQKLHSQLRDRRIVACCNYHRQQCRPVDVLDVVRRHHGALDHSGSIGRSSCSN